MARGKRNKFDRPRGGASGRPRGRTAAPSSPRSFGDRSLQNRYDTATFTMRDAARARPGVSSWSPSINLRHQSIGFIRSDERSVLDGPESSASDDEAESAGKPGYLKVPTPARMTDQGQVLDASAHLRVIVDGQPSILASSPPEVVTHGISTSSSASITSNASDDLVIFAGRNQARVVPNRFAQKCRISDIPVRSIKVVDDPFLSPESQLESIVQAAVSTFPVSSLQEHADAEPQCPKSVPPINSKAKNAFKDYIPLGSAGTVKANSRTQRTLAVKLSNSSDVADELEDYVSNMRESGMLGLTNEVDEGDSTHGDLDGWASSDLHDFDDLSTSDEVMGSVQQILAKRRRPGGTQYLVVWQGASVDDARWIPHESLVRDGAAHIISAFEQYENRVVQTTSGLGDDESDQGGSSVGFDFHVDGESDDEDQDSDNRAVQDRDDDHDLSNSDEDDKDLIERRIAGLSDERLARMLAKQEELGLGSDELVLFDGIFADDGVQDNESESELQLALATGRRRLRRRKTPSKRPLEFLSGFDEVVMFGNDDYSEFDVTDRERHSIVGISGKTRDPMSWDLSDSEQASTLRDVWAADRAKKKARKQQREELRAQGLLGKRNKFKPDLNAKYRDGMDLDQIGAELRLFLLSTAESRALPPMDKRDRKSVHEIASMFGLKSISKGSGRARFTTLQKTSKTADFDDELFKRLRGRLARHYFPRMDVHGHNSKARSRGRGGGSGVVRSDFGYRHGEVVGGTAPEIGSDNRGRAMLEKMGWTTGNALGALNNKGILQPIAHVVRNSRAGLG